MNADKEAKMTKGYQVQVDDNFHFMREDERWVLGNFATFEEALAAAKQLVMEFFKGADAKKSAEDLYDGFIAVGDDPFIVPYGGAPQPEEHFSAWDYAKHYSEQVAKARN